MMKQAKPLTREQYLKKFSRAARWRLPPKEAEEAIADYRELVFQEERNPDRLMEELGDPIQAAHLLTDVRTYRRWLKVFAVLAVGLFLLTKWALTGIITLSLFDVYDCWPHMWVMAVGLPLSLYWFRRYGQKNGSMSKWLMLALAAVLAYGVGTLAWTWYVLSPEFLTFYSTVYPKNIPWQISLQRELLINGGLGCALTAFAGLVLAKCYDRRWLALHVLGVTLAAMLGFLEFNLRSIDLGYAIQEAVRPGFFACLVPIGAVGLIGTGAALI